MIQLSYDVIKRSLQTRKDAFDYDSFRKFMLVYMFVDVFDLPCLAAASMTLQSML